MALKFQSKPFSFRLKRELHTAQGGWQERQGWLLRLEDSFGRCGWGEVSPLDADELKACGDFLAGLCSAPTRLELEDGMAFWPAALAFGVGAALGELDGLVGSAASGGWLPSPASAVLLPAGKALLNALDSVLEMPTLQGKPLTVKWKVAVVADSLERNLLRQLLERLPADAHFRIDANGGWDRNMVSAWVELCLHDPRLEWFEQPLPTADFEGLTVLDQQVPVALDESLLVQPSLRESWLGWQVRRPVLEGDPRPLLRELQKGVGRRMLSTAFETGIGRRWLHHLAALQQQGPTPVAPGLAPGWCPDGPLFSSDPEVVWAAA
ncbi:MAG: o-succinylbenzoate synthase [Prochlorococcus sp.]